MPRSHGNGQVEKSLMAMQQAQTDMLQAFANLAQHQTALLARISDLDAESSRRFRRIEKRATRIEAVLTEHGQILETLLERIAELPEAIQQKFGFQPPQPPA